MSSRDPFAHMLGTLTGAKPRKRPELASRVLTRAEMSEAESWDRAVSSLLGPVITEADREKRRTDALALAAAAMRAAEADEKRKINH